MVVDCINNIYFVFDIGCCLVGVFRFEECTYQRGAVCSILVKTGRLTISLQKYEEKKRFWERNIYALHLDNDYTPACLGCWGYGQIDNFYLP